MGFSHTGWKGWRAMSQKKISLIAMAGILWTTSTVWGAPAVGEDSVSVFLSTPKNQPAETPTPNEEDSFYRRYFRKGNSRNEPKNSVQLEEEQQLNEMDEKTFEIKPSPTITPTMVIDPVASELVFLIQELKEEHHRQMAAVERLSILGSRAVPALRRTLRDPYKFARLGALAALGYIHDSKTLPDIRRCLHDSEPDVRCEAVKTLGKMKDTGSLDELAALLVDPQIRIRREVIQALGRMNNHQVLTVLLRAVQDNIPEIRRLAVQELEGQPGENVIRILLGATYDPDRDVRLEAIRVLGESGSMKTVPRLSELSKNSDRFIRQAASQALANVRSSH